MLILLLNLLSSCLTQKKAIRNTYTAFDKYPDTITSVIRTLVPCKTTGRDTISIVKVIPPIYDTILKDTTIYIKCPQKGDSVAVRIQKWYITKTINTDHKFYINTTVKDNKDSIQLSDRLNKITSQYNKSVKQKATWRTLFWAELGLIILMFVLLYFMIKNK